MRTAGCLSAPRSLHHAYNIRLLCYSPNKPIRSPGMALASFRPAGAPFLTCSSSPTPAKASAAPVAGNARQQLRAVVDGRRQRRHVAAAAGGGEPKGNLGDELLDFMCELLDCAVGWAHIHADCWIATTTLRNCTASRARLIAPLQALHPPPCRHLSTDAGKKLRKWYGQEGQVLPRDGRPGPSDPQQPDEEEEEAVREYVAVLDADSCPMAEQVGARIASPSAPCIARTSSWPPV